VLNQCVLNWVFSETVTESWASVDGPRDDVSELPPQTLSFDTSDYVVSIGGNTLQANNGWYLIPAGAEVVITKEVSTDTTPNLVVQEADFTADASYTAASVRDKSYSWDIDRNLTITAVHDASAANIDAMSTRETQSLTGVRTYTISRP
jgi:hypothetical protein